MASPMTGSLAASSLSSATRLKIFLSIEGTPSLGGPPVNGALELTRLSRNRRLGTDPPQLMWRSSPRAGTRAFSIVFLGPLGFRRSGHYASPTLVFQTVALARDLHDGGVMQDAVEHCSGEHDVAGECLVPAAKGKVRREDHRALLVSPGDHLEKQIGLLTSEGKIADLVDDQELRGGDRAMHDLLQSSLALSCLQSEGQIGSRREADLPTSLRCQITERDGDVRLAGSRGAQQHHVLGALDEAQRGELVDLRSRHAGGKAKVESLERLDGREAGDPGQHVTSSCPTCLALGLEHVLQEVRICGVLLLRCALGNRPVEIGHGCQPELLAELADTIVLQGAHAASPVTSAS